MFLGAQHLQNIHPLVIHFPIAFLIGAALFYFSAWIFRREQFAVTAFYLLIIGAISLAVSIGTGLYAERGVMLHLSVREKLLQPHKNFMIVTCILCLALTVWALIQRPFPKRGRVAFLFLFLLMLGIMVLGVDFGGRMVYDYNAGGNACPQPIKFIK